MEVGKKLSSILTKARVPIKLRKLWQNNFDFLSAEQKILLLEVFKKSAKSDILKTSLLLDKKIKAITSGDKKQWDLILKSESNI